MKLIESTFTTLDGVISDPQVWGSAYWNDEHFNYSQKLLFSSDAMLLGRKTYEGFAESWPQRKGDEFSDRFNAMPKYVASRTLREATWNASILQGDAAEAVAELKKRPGGSLLKYGTGEFDRALASHRLVDEYHFWIFPEVLGKGDRLFDSIDAMSLKLLDTTTFSTGIVVHVYAPK